jgi:hypothetical protein
MMIKKVFEDLSAVDFYSVVYLENILKYFYYFFKIIFKISELKQ